MGVMSSSYSMGAAVLAVVAAGAAAGPPAPPHHAPAESQCALLQLQNGAVSAGFSSCTGELAVLARRGGPNLLAGTTQGDTVIPLNPPLNPMADPYRS